MINDSSEPRNSTFTWYLFPAEGLAILTVIPSCLSFLALWLLSPHGEVSTGELATGSVLGRTLMLAVVPAFLATATAYFLSYYAVFRLPRFRWFLLLPLATIFIVSHYIFLRGINIWLAENGIVHSLIQLRAGQDSPWFSNVGPDLCFFWLTAFWRYVPISVLFFCFTFFALGDSFATVADGLQVSWLRRHILLLRTVARTPAILSVLLVILLLSLDTVSPSVLLEGRWETAGTLLLDTAGTLETRHHAAIIGLVVMLLSAGIVYLTVRVLARTEGAVRLPDLGILNFRRVWSPGCILVCGMTFVILIVVASGLVAQSLDMRPRDGGMFARKPLLASTSIDGFAKLRDDITLKAAAGRTVIVALGSALIAALAGSVSAFRDYSNARVMSRNLGAWCTAILLLPLLLPQAVMGHSVAFWVQKGAVPDSASLRIVALVLGHAGLFVAIPFFAVTAALHRLGPDLISVARNLEVGTVRALAACWRAWLPAVCAGALGVICLSANEVVISQHLLDRIDTVAVVIEGRRYAGLQAQDYAAAVILLTTTILLLTSARWLYPKSG